jgi:hypothetical protein
LVSILKYFKVASVSLGTGIKFRCNSKCPSSCAIITSFYLQINL